MKIKILGSKYEIEKRKIEDDPMLQNEHLLGYCCYHLKKIVIAEMPKEGWWEYTTDEEKELQSKSTLRHEIIHAFLYESGLYGEAHIPQNGWALNEEMVDWIALQSPKIYKCFKKLKI